VTKPTINQIEELIREKYQRCETWFRSGEMRKAVVELYTEDLHYLAPNLQLIRGREALIEYFEGIQSVIAEVLVSPFATWGDPARVVYQFCNTERRSPRGGEISRAHYIASFREVNGDWLIEMEVPALGHIAT
jgi:ketosteroid isomerase-like protein